MPVYQLFAFFSCQTQDKIVELDEGFLKALIQKKMPMKNLILKNGAEVVRNKAKYW